MPKKREEMTVMSAETQKTANELQQVSLMLTTGPTDLSTPFVDLIAVESKPEVVILNFVQHMPLTDNPAPNTRSVTAPQSRLVTRVAVSWPHFARVVKTLSEVYEQNKERARQAFVDGVK